MKAILDRKALSDALQRVERAISEKTTLPILHNVLITTREEHLAFIATDLEVTIEVRLEPVSAEMGNDVTVPLKKFTDIVKQLDAGEVTLEEVTPGRIEIKSGRSHFMLLTLPPHEFPPVPQLQAGHVDFSLPEMEAHPLFKEVLPAMHEDDTRPILQSIELEVDGEEITTAATDTHRLHCRHGRLFNKAASARNVMVPDRAAEEIVRLLSPTSEANAWFSIDENQIRVEAGSFTLTSRLKEGTFPKWRRLKIDTDKIETILTVESGRLAQAVRRVGLIAKESENRLLLTYNGMDMMGLSAQAGLVGRGEDEFSVDGDLSEGKAVEVVFHLEQFQDAVDSFTEEKIALCFQAGPIDPVLVLGAGAELNGWNFCIVQPLNPIAPVAKKVEKVAEETPVDEGVVAGSVGGV